MPKITSKDVNEQKYYFAETSFNQLMRTRISQVLLICSTYDAFTLEEDGRIDEQIFMEYVSLNLRYPPHFIHASTTDRAMEILSEGKTDLVITMPSGGDMDVFELAKKIKSEYEETPIVVLTAFSREVSLKLHHEDMSAIDYVFSWLGNADILLAIIKLIEDKMNVEEDVFEVGVQTILLVEDSVRFYSSYLPNIYKIIFQQSKTFMREGLNEHQQMLRMRGRPKILLARNYEEAIGLYEKFKSHLLGIITDMAYERNGKLDNRAGIKLCERVKADDQYMPILIQSSEIKNKLMAKLIKVGFIHKASKTLSMELRTFIKEFFAFGDFKFIDPDTNKVITTASDLRSLQEVIYQIPDSCLQYHIDRNHFSKWLNARALFPIAEVFKYLRPEDFANLDQIRRFLFDTIANFRQNKGRGIISKFYRERYDEYQIFSRIGEGSIGGKARGLAFVDSLIKRNYLLDKFDNVIVTIPRTVVLSTDVFDEFMEGNDLYKIGLSDLSDEAILDKFVNSALPVRIHKDLYSFIRVMTNPIAVRSSSLLEDSHYQPFAGIYSTYMIPLIKSDECAMLDMLSNAIKSVYASVFYKDSKAYMSATSNMIDEEKMAIVLQEVCGKAYGDRFYPTISGVARSVNFYPIEPEKPEDGIVNIAFGLGKYVVEGDTTLRFSPKYPKKILQLSTADMALRETQKKFYSLDLNCKNFKVSINDGINLNYERIKEAEKDSNLKYVASTYDFQNNIIRDGINYEGKKIITFANILKYDTFPLPEIISSLLEVSQREMNNPVEIEFAVNLDVPPNHPKIFNVLQIRPIVDNKEKIDEDLELIKENETIIHSHSVLGNGIISDIKDFVYVKPESFHPSKTRDIATFIGTLNDSFIAAKKNYILVAPGRWGSSDPWLGIPVKWSQISAARLIVESGLENYRIDPSQGTHFFQNLTSFKVGYFTINPFTNDGYYDLEFLSESKAVYEDEFVRHIEFMQPVVIKIDGQKNIGMVMKPKTEREDANQDRGDALVSKGIILNLED
ncbi:MAG: phosphoenolpyruvate synthase [Bacteroidales bacterium]|nr:phosphoenolpyruvate synthase [Bacteroidales bacterium]MCF8457989.1 phosphoenolpyruvate synthase [Bacteroidales bacterium]